ncbi:MAG: uroporphyrinogen-III synthase [Methylococcaceae bacterium]|nr:uroporphyrinogen-III synthase [Methylococcaceae bacterium]
MSCLADTLKAPHILVTRPVHQADNLCQLIAQRGYIAVPFPSLEIVKYGDSGTIQNVLANLDRFHWVIFISANAVNFALQANGGKIEPHKSTRIAAIGHATAQALENAGIPVDLTPANGFTSEALQAMPQLQLCLGHRCLIVRGRDGREELADALKGKGILVEYLETYQRVIPDIDSLPVISLLIRNELNIITITSGEALHNLLNMLGKEYHYQLFDIPLVVVSERIKSIARQLGFKRIAVTDNPSDEAILNTIITLINEE